MRCHSPSGTHHGGCSPRLTAEDGRPSSTKDGKPSINVVRTCTTLRRPHRCHRGAQVAANRHHNRLRRGPEPSTSGSIKAAGIASNNVTARSENGTVGLAFAEAPASVDVTTDNDAVTHRAEGGLPDHHRDRQRGGPRRIAGRPGGRAQPRRPHRERCHHPADRRGETTRPVTRTDGRRPRRPASRRSASRQAGRHRSRRTSSRTPARSRWNRRRS